MGHGRQSIWSWTGLGICLVGITVLGWVVVNAAMDGGPRRVAEFAEIVVFSVGLGIFLTLGWTYLLDILKPPPTGR